MKGNRFALVGKLAGAVAAAVLTAAFFSGTSDAARQPVPEPKAVKNRLHLDLYPAGRDRSRPMDERRALVDEAVNRLLEAGASIFRRYPEDFDDTDVEGYFRTLRDPEGNEFCVS